MWGQPIASNPALSRQHVSRRSLTTLSMHAPDELGHLSSSDQSTPQLGLPRYNAFPLGPRLAPGRHLCHKRLGLVIEALLNLPITSCVNFRSSLIAPQTSWLFGASPDLLNSPSSTRFTFCHFGHLDPGPISVSGTCRIITSLGVYTLLSRLSSLGNPRPMQTTD